MKKPGKEAGEVFIVKPQNFQLPEPLTLDCGRTLKAVNIRYETAGTLLPDRSNAVLITHALSGDAHVCGRHTPADPKPGWWDEMIGPGKAIDTDRYFVICSNVLGSCAGSTGPRSVNPDTGNPYNLDFPVITIRDMVRAQKYLIDYLGIGKLLAVVGGSMGGSGSVQLATHFPEVFAAVRADVPVYSYSWERCDRIAPSAIRMVCSCGPFSAKNPARMPDGRDLLDYGNGAKNIARPEIDMPPIFANNGRSDRSIPWVNNPPFYRAANEARQAFQVFWNNGDHGMTRSCPKDMRPSNQELFRYRLDRCFVAFSNSSDNKDYGTGDSKQGDIIGWINRGMRFGEVRETPERCEVTLSAAHPEMRYPVRADVTLRRRQQFRPAPGSTIQVTVNGKTTAMRVPDGPLTIPGIVFADSKPVTLLLEQ